MGCPLERHVTSVYHAKFKGSFSLAVDWVYSDTGFVFDAQIIILQPLRDNSVYALPLQQIQDNFVSLPIYLIS